ncbi:MAG: hotdog fold thioesterase [Myxococcota bacterium]
MSIEDRARSLLAQDPASQHLGFTLVRADRDLAVLQMKVQDFMVNGHGICHGGFLFSFADSAFAFACADRGKAVVQNAQIEFLAPAHEGDALLAQAELRHVQGRRGLGGVLVRRGQELILDLRSSARFLDRAPS